MCVNAVCMVVFVYVIVVMMVCGGVVCVVVKTDVCGG